MRVSSLFAPAMPCGHAQRSRVALVGGVVGCSRGTRPSAQGRPTIGCRKGARQRRAWGASFIVTPSQLEHRPGRCALRSHSGVEGLPERNRDGVRRAVEELSSLGDVSLEPELLSQDERRRANEEPDSDFFATPCFAYHVDAAFRERLTEVYLKEITPGSKVLDLCSSFDSHLPPPSSLYVDEVIGHGLNDAELCANPRLGRSFTLDLNASLPESPNLPLQNGEVDAITCCCGIQYLTQPLQVLRECLRVLAPSGRIIVSFSSHAYAEKAIAGWLERSMSQRQKLVEKYLQLAGFVDVFSYSRICDAPGEENDLPAMLSDPFVAVTARRPGIAASKALTEVERLRGLKTGSSPPNAMPRALPKQLDMESRYSTAALERRISAYNAMQHEARQMGIPASAVPSLPEYPTIGEVQSAYKLLSARIASFMSASL